MPPCNILIVTVSEVSEISGENDISVSGNLNAVGDFVPGTFNTKTRTFTPADEIFSAVPAPKRESKKSFITPHWYLIDSAVVFPSYCPLFWILSTTNVQHKDKDIYTGRR